MSAVVAPRWRAHDLLWPADVAALQTEGAWPVWLSDQTLGCAPVVVRRAVPRHPGHVAVGVRGRARHERLAAELPIAAVMRTLTPEAIAVQAVPGLREWPVAWPCLTTLGALAPALKAQPLAWGPTGGVGFTLASGIDVLRDDSDLDLVVRAPSPTDARHLRALAPALPGHAARVDVQVDTGDGAFALAEWLRTGGPVMMKTATGPVLRDDPWRP